MDASYCQTDASTQPPAEAPADEDYGPSESVLIHDGLNDAHQDGLNLVPEDGEADLGSNYNVNQTFEIVVSQQG